MGIAWDDANKRLHTNVQMHEPADGVIEPKDPAFAGMLCANRRLNPELLASAADLAGAGVPVKYWVTAAGGKSVREMTAPEKAAQDAKPPPTPKPDPPDPT